MSRYDVSPDYPQEHDTSHTRVTAWLRGVALSENETSANTSNPDNAPVRASSLEDRWRSRAHRRLRGRPFQNYHSPVNDSSDSSRRYTSSNEGVSEVFPPYVRSHTPLLVACSSPTPTLATLSPSSIHNLDSGGREVFLPYVAMDWDSEPAQVRSPSEENIDESKPLERRTSEASTSLVSSSHNDNTSELPRLAHCPWSPSSEASFYAQQSAYYVPGDASSSEGDSPPPDYSSPSPRCATPATAMLSRFPLPPSTSPSTTCSPSRRRPQSSGREGARGGRIPPTHQRGGSSGQWLHSSRP
ncbi:hypothetical protein NLJ89_g1024 [Agrocybe chaxingu]|uniref:Uncharacterized protein n=1 Tax=Agrocybe chaxingu TaxID=84603 RepID=A0A9W8N0X0_9AGAR|nr:hypothetical protein NLJ89_g1024 [Agrocybe chaxingu]